MASCTDCGRKKFFLEVTEEGLCIFCASRKIRALTEEHERLKEHIKQLEKYSAILDIEQFIKDREVEAQELINSAHSKANEVLSSVTGRQAEAEEIVRSAQSRAEEIVRSTQSRADETVRSAQSRADEILLDANQKAMEISNNAAEVAQDAEKYTEIVRAMKSVISGYRNEYVLPAHSALDDLASGFEFADAAKKFTEARQRTWSLAMSGKGGICDYVEEARRSTAVRFVVDAFNGKVDSILSQAKHNNYRTLKSQIKDAFTIVNANGSAFRNARINPEYLDARLDELKWAVAVQELDLREREQQKEIRERMREEDRARKDYERAMKNAQKEQDYYQKAMEKAKSELAKASNEQRINFENQIIELEQKLKEAEEKNQRALSMAQLTRSGNVYVLSNIGSFGENVYKIGMTRRLDPLDRVRELGDASVPFPFDVHAIIYSDDAPALESELHKIFADAQVNKINARKEFFRINLSQVKTIIEQKGFDVSWTLRAEAQQYRETLEIENRIAENPSMREEWERYMKASIEEAQNEEMLLASNE